MQVGANVSAGLVFDPSFDHGHPANTSLLATNIEHVRACVNAGQIGYVVVRMPALRTLAEQQLQLTSIDHINGYNFYATSSEAQEQRSQQPCVLANR